MAHSKVSLLERSKRKGFGLLVNGKKEVEGGKCENFSLGLFHLLPKKKKKNKRE